MKELDKCKHCGGEPKFLNSMDTIQIECTKCGMKSPLIRQGIDYCARDKAIEIWNNRAEPEKPEKAEVCLCCKQVKQREKTISEYDFHNDIYNNPKFLKMWQEIIDNAIIKWHGNDEPDTTQTLEEDIEKCLKKANEYAKKWDKIF